MGFLNSDGLSHLVQGIKAMLNKKVDKVDGKGLSTNDYTNEEKVKLSGLQNYGHPSDPGNKHIPSGGQANQVLKWSADGTATWGEDKDTTYEVATGSKDGLMGSTDKSKLDGIESGATANDTKYDSRVASTVAVGGIPKGYLPPEDGIEAVDLLDKLLHAYVSPSVSAATKPVNGGVFEIGTTQKITGVTANITQGSAALKKVEVFDGSLSLGAKDSGVVSGANSVDFDLDISTNKTLKVTVTDAEDKQVSVNTGTFTFVSPYYYGAIDASAPVNSDAILALQKIVQVKGNKSFNFTCNNQKMVYAYPKSYGVLSKIFDANSFDVTGTFTRQEVTVGSVAYYVYVNEASTVSAFKMTFNY